MTTFKIFYANGQGVQDLVRILRRDVGVSDSYEPNSIYTVSSCGKSVSKVQELPREAETVLVLAGLGDPIDPVILPEWFNVFRKRNNTVIALLDPSAAFKEKFLSYLLPSDTLYYLEGFRNLRWGMNITSYQFARSIGKINSSCPIPLTGTYFCKDTGWN